MKCKKSANRKGEKKLKNDTISIEDLYSSNIFLRNEKARHRVEEGSLN